MKKIKNYGVTTLHVEELFGYLKQVETETANLPIGEDERPGGLSVMAATDSVLETKVNEFTTAVDAFDDALKASATNPATATMPRGVARITTRQPCAPIPMPTSVPSRNNARRCSTNTATPRSWRRPRKAACCTTSCKTLRHCPSPKSTFLSGWKT